METLLSKIYNELKYRRKVDSQTDFGEKLGYNRSYTSAILQKVNIPTAVATKLHNIFGVSLDYIKSEGADTVMFDSDKRPKTTTPSSSTGGNGDGDTMLEAALATAQKATESAHLLAVSNARLIELLAKANGN